MRISRIVDSSTIPLNHRVGLLLISGALYAMLFSISYLLFGQLGEVIAFSMFPVIVGGWLLGLRGGIVIGLLSYPLNALLFASVQFPEWQTVIARGVIGQLMLILLGAASGWISDLFVKARRQSTELGQEREKLERLVEELQQTEIEIVGRERRYRRLVEEATDVVYIVDIKGNIEYINTPGSTLTEYSPLELTGLNYTILIPPAEQMRISDFYRQQIREGKQETTLEFPIITRSGKEKWVEQTTNLLLDKGNITGLQSFARNITERKQTQEALKRAHKKALEGSELKTLLLANISHEFRTPLTAILGYAEMLQAGIFDPLTEGQHTTISRILASSEQMATLVNNLLDQAQIEDGRLTLNPSEFTPLDLLESIRKVFSLLADAKGIDFICQIDDAFPQLLVGDYPRLHQILMNLVNNAIKFTDSGQVQVHFSRPDDSLWKIQVSDTGSGIPLEVQAIIFDAFRQADSSVTRRFTGVGLGLTIVKELVNKMEGKITIESQDEKGSKFTILLPLVVATAKEQPLWQKTNSP
ncbi:MAG: PAS domain S-box protein [Chloroflexi bacterium]|nr:PAS domain S-box protein [Chloroflexota bacterium]